MNSESKTGALYTGTTPQSEGTRTTQEFWEARQAQTITLPSGGIPPSWLDKVRSNLPKVGSDCLEIGVVPGAALLNFATALHYRCHGVDYSDRICGVEAEFKRQGVNAHFDNAEFTSWQPDQKYDVVFSCGFIEHFDDYQSIIELHWKHVAENGLLILSVPVLTVCQKGLRHLLYTREKLQEVYDTHNLNVMNLKELRRCANLLPNSNLVASGYCGNMRIWFSEADPFVRPLGKFVMPITRLFSNLAEIARLSSSLYSPELFIAARKVSV